MNGHSVVFGQLVQKLEQIIPNSSTLQDDQNEWSQCGTWTAGSKVEIFLGLQSRLQQEGLSYLVAENMIILKDKEIES